MIDIAGEIARTSRAQRDAADPAACAWVSANAGTGKTYVLTRRVLSLLLTGTEPERILCLTFTKSAAAEMATRVFEVLARWVTLPAGELAAALADLLGRAPRDAEMMRARTLFARAIETPGGLKVQTIHAFCERVLQRFPVEAGVPPGFEVLEEETVRSLFREAIEAMLARAAAAPETALGRALQTVAAYAGEESLEQVLDEALAQRLWLTALHRAENGAADSFREAERIYRRGLGVPDRIDADTLDEMLAGVLGTDALARLRNVLSGGSASDSALAESIDAALAAPRPKLRAAALERFFCTKKGEPRQQLLTSALKAAHPDLDALSTRAQAEFMTLLAQRTGLEVIEATLALARVADAVLESYSELKARRAALDFDDLIERTASLLRIGPAAEWVLYKLDGGLDHILVDEAQDTSPAQWQVIEKLAEEFFSGSGDGSAVRTLFAVGDEKQSIYGFQDAAPEMFAAAGERFAALATAAGQIWRQVPLHLSFRSVAPILAAVDRVFADDGRTPGLKIGESEIRHVARRFDQAGFIEIWPTEAPEDCASADAWSPLEEETAQTPVARLADRIADTIKGWLENGERLVSENRAVRAGDILILVRKRQPFAAPMVAALKARGIPCAGADRMQLAEQLAVQDLVAVGAFVTLPEDDLALANVLKGPFFGLDDDALFEIAYGRKGSLWSALIANAELRPAYREAAETLKRWRARADAVPPYEFFAGLLDRDGMRRRLLGRLGPEAADPIDEFLDLALRFDETEAPSLVGFLDWLTHGGREIKRDMEQGRDEVRVMTVHGAKGLEAPIVFLPDTCTTAAGRQPGGLLALDGLPRPEGMPELLVWTIKGAYRLDAVRQARRAREAEERAERNRLLYVAMTRARDRLYVTGFEGKRARPADCWYDLVREGLAGCLEEARDAQGRTIWRSVAHQAGPHDPPRRGVAEDLAAQPRPPWATRAPPPEPQLVVPLAPSRLAPYESDVAEESAGRRADRSLREPSVLAPSRLGQANRFLRGVLTHALLQHLPAVPPAQRARAAAHYLEVRAAPLPAALRESIAAEVLAILEDAAFAPLFGPASRAEVPIIAEVARPSGAGAPLKIIGQIDRLCVSDDEVLIVDYKTNRPPPQAPESVPRTYLLQLAAYRLALARIYPGKPLRAAILWTDGPRIMPIPLPLLEACEGELWDIDPSCLDG